MRDLIEYVATSLVADPDAVRVETYARRDFVTVVLNVSQEDMGRVIGRQGRVANAMRTLLKVMATRSDTRVGLDIEPNDNESDQD